jgi:membrane dipeptidase
MFAIFPPPVEKSRRSAVPPAPSDNEPLPPELPRADALDSTIAMASILFRLERASALTVCRSAGDVHNAMAQGSIAAVFHIEGVEAIDPELTMLDILHAAGLRSLGIVWSRPNAFGNGVPFRFPSSPDTGPGLTDAGKALVKACNQLKIMIDLSHLNEKGFRDVAAISESGGMVGLNFATGVLREDGRMNSDTGLDIMVRHVDSLLQALGEDGVGLGSDFDGAMIPAVIGDVAGLPKLIDALAARGFGRALIEKIAYRNWLGMLERTIG